MPKMKQNELTPDQRRILIDKGTELPFTGALLKEKRLGSYRCANCGSLLFSSKTKFDSGTGWPSFYDIVPGAVDFKEDVSFLSRRTEVHCATCRGHLGHVFHDGPRPTGMRYCLNSLALYFEPQAKKPQKPQRPKKG